MVVIFAIAEAVKDEEEDWGDFHDELTFTWDIWTGYITILVIANLCADGHTMFLRILADFEVAHGPSVNERIENRNDRETDR